MTAEQLGELQALSPAWAALSSNQRARPFVGIASSPAGCNNGSRWISRQNRGRQPGCLRSEVLAQGFRRDTYSLTRIVTHASVALLGRDPYAVGTGLLLLLCTWVVQLRLRLLGRGCGKSINASPTHPALYRVLRDWSRTPAAASTWLPVVTRCVSISVSTCSSRPEVPCMLPLLRLRFRKESSCIPSLLRVQSMRCAAPHGLHPEQQ